ncbi:MAG: hypothetical protein FD127_1264 [Acidimicrobiaceae bacterium]|nr:MAG: hypothetical protein FD127_1264 [Acidimicrobiaceae bacterium]
MRCTWPSARAVTASCSAEPVALPVVTVQGWFATNDAQIEPGAASRLALTITNLGSSTESYALTPTGLAAAFSTIRPAYVTLFGGSEETVEVEVSAPRLPGTTAGPTALGVRIVPQNSPDDVALAELTLHVASTFDRRLQMLQPAIRSRRKATYEMMVENRGNTQASCRMHLIDPTGRLDGDFDPPAAGVEPGGTTLVRLKLRATKRQWERRSRAIPFRVEADQQGAPTADTAASFIQAPMVPERLWARVAAAALLVGALAGTWYGVVRPAIDDAAASAVAAIGQVAPATTTAPAAAGPVSQEVGPGSTVAPVDLPSGALEGEPFSVGLPGGAALNEISTQTYTAPDDSAFLVTDFFVQNPFGDEGTATMTVGTVSFEWDLVNLDGIDATKQFVTPLRVLAGEQVVFEVTCASIGRQGAAACSAKAVVNGRLVAA